MNARGCEVNFTWLSRYSQRNVFGGNKISDLLMLRWIKAASIINVAIISAVLTSRRVKKVFLLPRMEIPCPVVQVDKSRIRSDEHSKRAKISCTPSRENENVQNCSVLVRTRYEKSLLFIIYCYVLFNSNSLSKFLGGKVTLTTASLRFFVKYLLQLVRKKKISVQGRL